MSFLPIGLTANLILNRLRNQVHLADEKEQQHEHQRRPDHHDAENAEHDPRKRVEELNNDPAKQ